MDDEVVIIGDDGTEHVFPAGFDPKKAAAIVRGGAEKSAAAPVATAATGAALGVAKAAPYLMQATSAGAKAVSGINPIVGSMVGSVAGPKGAAIGAAAPKVAGVVAKATAPLKLWAEGGRVVGTPAGPLMRGAGWLSRIAGKAAPPIGAASTAYDMLRLLEYEAQREASLPEDDPQRHGILTALQTVN